MSEMKCAYLSLIFQYCHCVFYSSYFEKHEKERVFKGTTVEHAKARME